MLEKSVTRLYNFFFNYATPSNLTNVWNFGVLSFFFLAIQIISGFLVSVYYVPHEVYSFIFVEYIMRDSVFGFYFRYIHSNGASLFFFCVYVHFFRSLYYFSYIYPKLLIWNTGVGILVLMILTAFTGYVLPWGQMSFWAATVITNLVTVIPIFGKDVVNTIWGSFGVSTITLNRFYTAHFFLPFGIVGLVGFHFNYLHKVGSSNNLSIENKNDKMPFHPYYTIKDLIAVLIIIIVYFLIVVIAPNYLGHSDNYIPANSLLTPAHIVPEWYFLAYYAILRTVPHKLMGVLLMFSSLAILFIFPFFVKIWYKENIWHRNAFNVLDIQKVWLYLLITKRINPLAQKYLFWFFLADFIGLCYIGMMPLEEPYMDWARLLTFGYFFYFCSTLYLHSFHYWMSVMVTNDRIVGYSFYFRSIVTAIAITYKKTAHKASKEFEEDKSEEELLKEKEILEKDIQKIKEWADRYLRIKYDPDEVSNYRKHAPEDWKLKDTNYELYVDELGFYKIRHINDRPKSDVSIYLNESTGEYKAVLIGDIDRLSEVEGWKLLQREEFEIYIDIDGDYKIRPTNINKEKTDDANKK